MSAVHRIRLRGGWKIERAADGSAVFERSFGSPRTLDAGESVWLTCESVPVDGCVQLNDEVAGACVIGAFAVEITKFLLPRNVVRFALRDCGNADIGEVALEFRSPLSSP